MAVQSSKAQPEGSVDLALAPSEAETATIPPFTRRVLALTATDPQLQELVPIEPTVAALTAPGRTAEEIVTTLFEAYTSRPALGERSYGVTTDPDTGREVRHLHPQFDVITYGDLCNRVRALAMAWREHDQHRLAEGSFICTFGFAGIDYTTVDLACIYAHAVAVPLQTSLAGVDLEDILLKVAPTALAATVDDVVRAAELSVGQPTVRSIVVFDVDDRLADHRDRLAEAQDLLARTDRPANIALLDDLLAFGRTHPWTPLPSVPDAAERVRLIVHSSGSTGTPKGVIINDRYTASQFTAALRMPVPVPVVRLNFAPMNHFMSRYAIYGTLARGGTAYFTAEPDMSTLFEDFRLVRPTETNLFPRAFETIHQEFLSEVALRCASGQVAEETAHAQVMAEMANFLGDRLSIITTASAPTSPELKAFIARCFPVSQSDNYGMTEAGTAIATNQRVNRPEVIDYKLTDVPDLGYYTTDKPYPRGELCVKTRLMVPGYFKNPEASAALFDADGYIRTGDIMEERGPDHIVYVDRRNDVLKLAQGEFVTLGALGGTFENSSDVIRQIYVYGSSSRAYLLAVVVPNKGEVDRRLGPDASGAHVKALIRSELTQVRDEQHLRSFEVPRDFIVDWEPFTHENGLLSSVLKRLRPALRRKYGGALEALYVELDSRRHDDIVALQDPTSPLSVPERVVGAVAATLSTDRIDLANRSTFSELGGDSLGAMSLSTLLTSMFGVEVPVNAILSPAGNVASWSKMISSALARDASSRPTFASIHGAEAHEITADQLDIANFLPADLRDSTRLDEPPTESRTVLITGVTGFLGRFLCLEWLERMETTGGKVICLVRAPDKAAAESRLSAAFGSDPSLAQRFSTLAARHLEIVIGDLADERFGLSSETYERLARTVDRIVHPAALVNHVFTYEELFGPNVAGTAELVTFALTERMKRFDFVSSLAVVRFLQAEGCAEDSPLSDKVTLRKHYTAGYGASKWAAEQLLYSANRRFALPVNVFRGDMILPHRRLRGQVNAPDIFIRLLVSLVTTGLAPESFYTLESDNAACRAHYDGLPVDFFASAMIGAAGEPHRELRVFHVVNPHDDDGVSLDTFVDWIEGAGYPITRIASYADWLHRFEDNLHALPDELRQQSSLPVLASLQQPAERKPTPPSARFSAAVARQSAEPAIPHLTRSYVEKCLDDLRELRLIGEPAASTSAPLAGTV
jgi:fatty acid CoA ligase FadD9